jgi:small-conductance mechanosensitive channel
VRWLAAALLGFCATGAALVQALDNGGPADPEPVIAAAPKQSDDAQIQQRITAIFAQLADLDGVQVSVREGVVRLSGSVAKAEHADTAQALAIRLAGVVTVVDEIERSVAVDETLVPLLDEWVDRGKRWVQKLPLLLFALVAFAVIGALGHWLATRQALWRRLMPNSFLAELLGQAVRVAGLALGLMVALSVLGATAVIGTVLGGAGILTLAVGFAIRDTLENYISSIMLSLRQPFRANDYVRVNDFEGTVVRLTSRATVLMTGEGNQLRIPNSTVFKAVILNYTRNPERRFDFDLGVDAADDPLAAIQCGLQAVTAIEHVLESPRADAYVKTVGDSNIVLTFTGWVNQERADWRKVRGLAIRAAIRVLEAEGFTLPEPIYRIRVDQAAVLEAGQAGAVVSEAPSLRRPQPRTPPAAPDETELSGAAEDVSPDSDVSELVAEQRAAEQETDLLDASRPTE